MIRLYLLINLLILAFSWGLQQAAPELDSSIGQACIVEIDALIPGCQEKVNFAAEALSQGWDELTPEEQQLFNRIFDPAETGKIDGAFIATVADNYRRIGQRLEQPLPMVYEPDSDRCQMMRLFYTDGVTIHICPYFNEDEIPGRKERSLIHEAAHQALLVVDRPYYDPKSYSTRYQALTPTGSKGSEIPLIGPIIRELCHCDTLYHPDAYAWFAEMLETMREDEP